MDDDDKLAGARQFARDDQEVRWDKINNLIQVIVNAIVTDWEEYDGGVPEVAIRKVSVRTRPDEDTGIRNEKIRMVIEIE